MRRTAAFPINEPGEFTRLGRNTPDNAGTETGWMGVVQLSFGVLSQRSVLLFRFVVVISFQKAFGLR